MLYICCDIYEVKLLYLRQQLLVAFFLAVRDVISKYSMGQQLRCHLPVPARPQTRPSRRHNNDEAVVRKKKNNDEADMRLNLHVNDLLVCVS